MFSHAKIRSVALVLSGVLLLGTLGTLPAYAEEPVAEPSATSTPEPSATSTPEAPAPEETAAVEPTAVPTSTPTSSAPAAAAQAITLKGVITHLSDEAHGNEQAAESPVQLFRILGQGYLPLDFSAVNLGPSSINEISVSVSVPASVDLSGNAAADFLALQDFTLAGGELAVLDIVKSIGLKNVDGQINTLPATAAVHKVYAVMMTPANIAGTAPAANQTAARVAAAVQHASQYWSDQSAGAITFALQGTVPWYKTTNAAAVCSNTTTGPTAMWAEAATKAAAQIGYRDAPNNHLVLFLPSGNAGCAGPIGLAAIGRTINEGGHSWVIGTNTNNGELSTLAHELGHNLSFGHANWADCSTANPYPGFMGYVGCTIKPYGDIQDVMGFGVADKTGGSLSSPHAIRGGLWDADDYTVAPQGTSSYTLQAVGSGAGKRAVVVQDNLGAEYFVEFRNFLGTHDAQYSGAGGCVAGSGAGSDFCVATQPGVRIMRLEQQSFGGTYYNGVWGDDAYLIGRIEGGVKKVNYPLNGVFNSQVSGGIKVTVTGLTSTTATVSIVRPTNTVDVDFVDMTRTAGGYDDNMRVGETMTAMLGAYWEADSFSYKWYRTGVLISGATKQSYTLTAADLGKNMRVSVTAVAAGSASRTVTDPPTNYIGYAAVLGGVLDAGTVSVAPTAAGLTATLDGWTAGATNSLQWYRGTTAIAGAKSLTYVPTTADRDAQLKVRVTSTRAGFLSASAESTAAEYTLETAGTVAASGTGKVGATLSVSGLNYTTTQTAPVPAVIRAYQWLRGTVAIAGATSATYRTVAADLNKPITVRVVATVAGFAPHTSTAPTAITVSQLGDIDMSAAVPVVSKAGLALSAQFPNGTIVESAPIPLVAWQWMRDGVPITGATKATYSLVAADVNKSLAVRATLTKVAYNTVVRTSAAANHSLLASGAPTISGTARVGLALTAGTPSYSTVPSSAGSPTVAYQWYRGGVAVVGATGSSYTLVAADYNKAITVRTIGSMAGYLPATGVSVATAVVAKGIISGSQSSANVTKNAAGTILTAAPTTGAVSEPGVAYAYQWYRNGVAIAKATKPTFAVTVADRAKLLHVRIIVTKLNYTSVTLLSAPINYTVSRALNPDTDGTIRVGGSITVNSSWYELDGVTTTLTPVYQWLRAGVVIPNATGTSYAPVAADLGKAVSVRITAAAPGYISYLGTSPAKVVAPGVLAGPFVVPTVGRAGITLTATPGSVGEPAGVTYGYQWYRNGVAIATATKLSYTLTTLDAGKLIHVRQLATKLAYTAVPLLSEAINYSLQRSAPPEIVGTAKVAETLSINSGTFFLYNGGSVEDTAPAYQWYRSGAAIAGATAATYTVVPADLAKLITVRLSKKQEPTLPYLVTSAATAKVAPGTIIGDTSVPTVTKDPATLILTAGLPAESIKNTVGAKGTYQWYRSGVAIAKATAATYKLTALDFNKDITVRVTVTKVAYATVVLTSAVTNASVVPSTPLPVITGNVAIGQPLAIAARSYSNGGAATYQWLRGGVAIAGAIAPSYTPVALDKAKAISVRVTASSSGFLPSISTSAATQLVAVNFLAGGDGAVVTVAKDVATTKLTVTGTGVTGPDPVTRTYQWYRSGVAIVGATAVSYTPVAVDVNKLLSVRVIHTKATYTTVVAWSPGVNVSVAATGTAVISPTLPVRGAAATVTAPSFAAPDLGAVTVSYQWYRSGVAIPLATASSYTPVTADKGKLLSVRVTGARTGFLSAVVASAATKALA